MIQLLLLLVFVITSTVSYGAPSCKNVFVEKNNVGNPFLLDIHEFDVELKPSLSIPEGGTVEIAPGMYRISVAEKAFNYLAAPEVAGRQRQSNWCWAAALQMILNYKGVLTTQEHLVEMLYGVQVDQPANKFQIMDVMNHNFTNIHGRASRVESYDIDPFVFENFIHFLGKEKQPMLIGLRGSQTGATGHAYVLTGAEFKVNARGEVIEVTQVNLRDPWPMNPTEKNITWNEFAQSHIFSIGLKVTHY